MNIALIAHDRKKEDIIEFSKRYKEVLIKHNLVATGTTGKLLNEKVGLEVKCYLSGPMGGDQQIGSQLADGNIDIIIFIRDALTAQPHEPDITALIRLCDVHNIPLATNLGTAEIFIKALNLRKGIQ